MLRIEPLYGVSTRGFNRGREVSDECWFHVIAIIAAFAVAARILLTDDWDLEISDD